MKTWLRVRDVSSDRDRREQKYRERVKPRGKGLLETRSYGRRKEGSRGCSCHTEVAALTLEELKRRSLL